jgi:hypothetical protein
MTSNRGINSQPRILFAGSENGIATAPAEAYHSYFVRAGGHADGADEAVDDGF